MKPLHNSFSFEKWKKTVSMTLRDLRKRKQLTQRQVADILLTSESTISHYEKGISTPTIENIVLLAKLYDVSTDYILGVSPSRTNDQEKLEIKLGKDISLDIVVKIIENATAEEKKILYDVFNYIRKNQESKKQSKV